MREYGFYKCYSWRLKNWLKANGVSFINKGFNEDTQSPFWIFEITDELSELLKIWSEQYHEKIKN